MKPLLVGLHNPLSRRPEDALVPWPPNCTGDRLLRLIRLARPETTEDEYLESFERTNLWRLIRLPYGRGSAAAFEAEGERVRDMARGRPVTVLLGSQVMRAVLGRHVEYWERVERDGAAYVLLPHPSGRNYLYKIEANRVRAGRWLAEIMRDSQ